MSAVPSPSLSQARLAGAGVKIGLAALLLVVHAVVFEQMRLRDRLLTYDLVAHDHPNPGESIFFLMQWVLGLPAILLVCSAGLDLVSTNKVRVVDWLTQRPRSVALIATVSTAVLAVLVRMLVYRQASFTDDEGVYLFQARALLAGDLTPPAPGPLELFAHQFMLEVPGDRWAGVYWIGQPALLAIGLTIGAPYVTQLVFGAGTVYLAARLAARLWDERIGVLTALLLASSPFLVCASATLHNDVPATFLLLAAVLAALRARDRGDLGSYALVGLAVGLLQLVRAAEGLFGALAAAVILFPPLLRPSERSRRIVGLAVTGFVGLAFVALQLESFHAVTGNHLASPAAVFGQQWPDAKIFGFGKVAFDAVATPGTATAKTFAVLARMSSWCFGWPGTLLPLALAAFGLLGDRIARALLAFVALHFAFYFALTSGSVHDIASMYHLFDLPFIAILTVVALERLRERLAPLGAVAEALPWRLVAAGTIVALLSFWPSELSRLAHLARKIRAPLESAAAIATGQGPILVFWESVQPPGPPSSWVYFPPPPGPRLDDAVLWVRDTPVNEPVMAAYKNRRPFRLTWAGERPTLEPMPIPSAKPRPSGPAAPKEAP